MLHLNINKLKSLVFEAQIGSIQPDQLKGSLKLIINNVEYGFPVTFRNESIIVDIPPLKNIINANLKEGDIIESRLEANGDGFYMEPWSGKFTIQNPVIIEATIKEDIDYDSNKEIIAEIDKPIKETITKPIKETITKPIKEKNKKKTYNDLIKENITNKLKGIQTIIKDSKNKNSDTKINKETITKPIKESITKPNTKTNKESDKETYMKTIKESLIEANTKPIIKIPEEYKDVEITKEIIFEFMTKVGTKKEAIQELLYTQSITEANSSDPKEVFKKVREILRK